MSSPTSEPAAPAPEVKEEDSIVADSGAPDAAECTAPPTVEDGLTKKDFDLMTGILHRITNFRDEEYVPTLKYPTRLIGAN
jgi:chromatin structure-remodeling complex subunit RSC1/2